jgi:hypothetical protein
VDEIELFISKLPALFEIIDVEFQIRWHKAGLDGGKICPNDSCTRMFVSEFNRPDAGSGADVEDPLRLGDRSSIQRATQAEAVDVVLEVKAILLCFVVW